MTIITEKRPKNKWVAKAEISDGVPFEYPCSPQDTEAQAVAQVMRIAAMRALILEINPHRFYLDIESGVSIKRL